MPPTYLQLIESALTVAAKEGKNQFTLTWLRHQIRTQARKAKKRLGPRLNKAIMHTLDNEAQSGCLRIQHGTCDKDITVDMSAGGVDKYKHRTAAVTIIAQPAIASKSRADLQQENERLKSDLLKMETRLARANSLIDIENNGGINMVTGLPAAIMERIERLVVLSKNRKDQISLMQLMHDEEKDEHKAEILSVYLGQDSLERKERKALVKAYRELDGLEESEGEFISVESSEHNE